MVFGKGGNTSIPVLNLVIGIIGIILCIFNCFVVCKHPAFQKGGEYYSNGVGSHARIYCRLRLLLSLFQRNKRRARRRRKLLYVVVIRADV